MSDEHRGGLLAGVRVLDLGIFRPVPYATQLLVEMGAEVVKVEPPGGDPMRAYPGLFSVLNAGKRSAAIDLKDREGRAAVLALAAGADVVIEGFRPGVVTKLGVDDAAVRRVNQAVVYCSISGYGQSGSLTEVPGHDVNYQAWAGALEPRSPNDPPEGGRLPVADLAAGGYAAMAICAALLRRSRTGEGERIDVAMADVIASWVGPVTPDLQDVDEHQGGMPGYGTFRTADGGWIALGVIVEDHFWTKLMGALGFDDVASLGLAERVARTEELNGRIAEAIARRPRDEVVAELTAAGAPVSPILSQAEMLAAEHFRSRGLVVPGPDGGPAMGHPIRYDHHPARLPIDVPPLVDGPAALPTWSPR